MTIKVQPGEYDTILDRTKPYKIIHDNTGWYKTIRDHIKLNVNIKDQAEINKASTALEYHTAPYRVSKKKCAAVFA